MVKVEFSNKTTRGCMLVDEGWYDSHTQIKNEYELYQAAEEDENRLIIVVKIMVYQA